MISLVFPEKPEPIIGTLVKRLLGPRESQERVVAEERRRRGWREAELALPPSLGATADTSAQGGPREGGDGLALAPRNYHDIEIDRETA